MNGYRWNFDEPKYISFLIKDKKLLGKCNEILGKVRKTIKKNLIMSQLLSEEYKYIVKEKELTKYINEDLEISPDEKNTIEESSFEKKI